MMPIPAAHRLTEETARPNRSTLHYRQNTQHQHIPTVIAKLLQSSIHVSTEAVVLESTATSRQSITISVGGFACAATGNKAWPTRRVPLRRRETCPSSLRRILQPAN